jgi:hypothetical protein
MVKTGTPLASRTNLLLEMVSNKPSWSHPLLRMLGITECLEDQLTRSVEGPGNGKIIERLVSVCDGCLDTGLLLWLLFVAVRFEHLQVFVQSIEALFPESAVVIKPARNGNPQGTLEADSRRGEA